MLSRQAPFGFTVSNQVDVRKRRSHNESSFYLSLCDHWHGFDLPDIGCILSYRPIAGELAGTSYVHYGFARPLIAVLIERRDRALCLGISSEVSQMHVVVTMRQKHVIDRTENSGLVAAEMVREN